MLIKNNSTKYEDQKCYYNHGDDMKKTFILGIAFILLGTVVGTILRGEYQEEILDAFGTGKSYYFLQEGVYSTEENLEENIKNLDTKLIIEEDGKYYVYLGITQEKANAEKIKQIYENDGYQIYIKERNISNEEFYNNVNQFDLLIQSTDNPEEILTIEEVVLANYEEIVKKDK